MAIEINPSTPSSPIPSVNGISVIWLGNWTSNKIYRRNEGVFYNGSSYRANKTTSQTPSSLATDWDLLAQGGSGGGGGTINPTNLDELTDVIITSPIDGQSLVYDNSTGKWVNETIISSGGGSGEANTASNVGTNGVGVFKQKTGVNLEFKKLNAASNKISITDDTINSDVDIDVVEANLTLGNLTGTLPISKGGTGSTTASAALTALGAASNAALTSHTGNTSNPHNTTAAQVGAIPTTAVGTANGVASLDTNTLVPITQIPTSIARASDVTTALSSKADTSALTSHTGNTSNPHNTTAAQVGAIPTSDRGVANGVASLDASTLIPIAQIPTSVARASDVTSALSTKADTSVLTSHTNNTSNPHNTTAAQVGNSVAQWNSDKLQGVNIHTAAPTNGQVLTYSSTNTRWEPQTPATPGEINTASNVGTTGIGVFRQKTGVNLEFKRLNVGSSKITITDDTVNNEIDIDVTEANLSLSNIGGTLPLAKGGTGATTASAALTALGGLASTTRGAASGVASLDANTLVPDAQISTNIARVSQITATQAGAIATTARGTANGVASLDANTLIPIAQIPTTIARASDLTTHTFATNNPHNTTAAQVGNTTAQWNANQIQSNIVSSTTPTNGQVLTYVSGNSRWEPQSISNTTAQWNANQIQGRSVSSTAPTNGQAIAWNSTSSTWQPTTISGSGEINTASNVGTGGVGVFRQKTGVNLEFRNINAGSNKITVTSDTVANEIDIDVIEANLSLPNLGGTLPLTKGGTGATTASAALTALGGLATTTRGAANGVASLDSNTLVPDAQIPSTIARVSQVTASQVGNTTAQWNANQIRSTNISTTAPTNGQVLTYNSTSTSWEPSTPIQYAPLISPAFSGEPTITRNSKTLNLVNYGNFFVGGNDNTFYPVQFRPNQFTFNPSNQKIRIYRTDIHEDSYAKGSFSIDFSFTPSGWGNQYPKIEVIDYTVGDTNFAGLNSLHSDPVANIIDGSYASAGNDVIVWLRGNATYHWMTTEANVSWTLLNPNSSGTSITDSSGGTQSPTTVQSDLILNAKGWRQLSLLNGWANFGSEYQNLSVKKNGNIIKIQGLITCGSPLSDTNLAVLPSGMRPTFRQIFLEKDSNNNLSRIDILTQGDIRWVFYISGSGNIDYLPINISFSL
ncbi:MAG: beta strand repeat-containing protein [Gloeotrichia echinulata DVL01]